MGKFPRISKKTMAITVSMAMILFAKPVSISFVSAESSSPTEQSMTIIGLETGSSRHLAGMAGVAGFENIELPETVKEERFPFLALGGLGILTIAMGWDPVRKWIKKRNRNS